MKTLNPRMILVAIGALIAAAWLAPEVSAQTYSKCWYVCDGTNSSCTQSCIGGGGLWTTCDQWLRNLYGGTANDLDADGVPNSSDNCLCRQNSNQANCDGDSDGNACDPLNGVFVKDKRRACRSDAATKLGFWDIGIWYEDRFVDISACKSAPRYNIFKVGGTCTFTVPVEDCCRYALENRTRDGNVCPAPKDLNCAPDTW